MNPNIDVQQIDAFIDDELDLTRRLEIERAIAEDADIRSRVEDTRDLRAQIRRDGDYFAAPAALRQRIESLASAAPARQPRRRIEPSFGERLQVLWGWRPLSAVLATALTVAVASQFYFDQERRTGRLTEEVVGNHVRSTLSEHLIDVSSSDHHTVKPFLSSKLPFSPPVRDSGLGNAQFVGGRVDFLDGRAVAALVYRQGPHLVNTFIWPSATGDSKPAFSNDKGFQIAHWSRDGMNYWVISDVNETEFRGLVQLLGS